MGVILTDMSQLTGRERPHVSGFRHRRIRDFQALPYDWGELTGVDVMHLKQAVRAKLDGNPDGRVPRGGVETVDLRQDRVQVRLPVLAS